MRTILILTGAILIGAAASAETPREAEQGAQAQSAERPVCRVFRETGSRLNRRRVCLPQSEWDLRDSQAQIARYQSQLVAPTEMRPAEAAAALRACPTC